MLDNTQYNNTIPNPPSFKEKKKVLILLGVVILLFIMLVSSIFLLRRQDPLRESPIVPTPTPLEGQSLRLPPTVAPQDIEKKLDRTVKNIHWLNDNELAYSYHDMIQRQTILAKTNSETLQENLAEQILIKFASFYWSKRNDLLIHELSSPSKAYLLPHNGQIVNLNLRGNGYSWSPDGTRLFFNQYQSDSSYAPHFYSLSARTSTPVTTSLPEFTHSLWSPDGDTILLYKNVIGMHENDPYLFNIKSQVVTRLETKELGSPSWSPSGASLAYLTDKGLYIKNNSGADKVYYEPSGSFQTVTYTWINEQEVLLVDSFGADTKIIQVPLYFGEAQEVLTNLSLKPDQRIEISLSPDNKTIALATEKDGLLFVSLP